MNWKVFGIASGVAMALAFALGSIDTKCHDQAIADTVMWCSAVATGIVLGEAVFWALHTATKRQWGAVREVSAMLSGLLSAFAGLGVAAALVIPAFNSVVFERHPGLYTGDAVYLGMFILCAFVSGVVGLIFGTGLGQRTRRESE